MTSMSEILINDESYILADDIVKAYPSMFKEAAKRSRQMVLYKKIPVEAYLYASLLKKGWHISKEENKKAKLLVLKSWLTEYLEKATTPTNHQSPPVEKHTGIVQDAPPVLLLTDDEKFKDEDGNVLNIEVRGERDENKCYFRVKDVSFEFRSPNLLDDVVRSTTSFEEGDDYLYLRNTENFRSTDNTAGQQKKKELFFTYHGMLRFLFVSRSKVAHKFRKWASRILFAAQMGTQTQRRQIASQILGVSPEVVLQFSKTNVRDIPLVYLMNLGAIPDDVSDNKTDYLFVKVGGHGFNKQTLTGFEGRCKGHQQEFNEFRNTMGYLHIVFIDPMYVSEAEKAIKQMFAPYSVHYKNHKELFLIPKNEMENVERFFKTISYEYSGNTTDVQRAFDNYKTMKEIEIKELTCKLEKQQLTTQLMTERLHDKDKLIEKQELLEESLKRNIDLLENRRP